MEHRVAQPDRSPHNIPDRRLRAVQRGHENLYASFKAWAAHRPPWVDQIVGARAPLAAAHALVTPEEAPTARRARPKLEECVEEHVRRLAGLCVWCGERRPRTTAERGWTSERYEEHTLDISKRALFCPTCDAAMTPGEKAKVSMRLSRIRKSECAAAPAPWNFSPDILIPGRELRKQRQVEHDDRLERIERARHRERQNQQALAAARHAAILAEQITPSP